MTVVVKILASDSARNRRRARRAAQQEQKQADTPCPQNRYSERRMQLKRSPRNISA